MAIVATNFLFDGQTDIYRGETRDVYILDDTLISIASDRLSVFGHLFPEPIPFKGHVLNQITAYFADATKDIIPNWIISVPDPNVIIGKKCDLFAVNMVIRGSLTGHAWRIYEAGARTISGVELPDGMKEYDLFDEPIITPSTKAPAGFEEDIAASEIIEQGIMSESEFERLSIVSRQLFIRGREMARQKGLILADTKYEFGRLNDEIYLIDEIHTPDNSRYYQKDEYKKYQANPNENQTLQHMSKEFVRQWALGHGYSGLDDQIAPKLSDDMVSQISDLYIHLYEQLIGKKFKKPDQDTADIGERIEKNIKQSLHASSK